MGFRTLSAVLVGSALLGGCVHPDMTNWTEAEKATYWAREEAATQELLAYQPKKPQIDPLAVVQMTKPGAPQVGPYGQQPNTAIVYCRDLSGNVIACKQVN